MLDIQINFKGCEEINSAITINATLEEQKLHEYSRSHYEDDTLLPDLTLKMFLLGFGFSHSDAVNLITPFRVAKYYYPISVDDTDAVPYFSCMYQSAVAMEMYCHNASTKF